MMRDINMSREHLLLMIPLLLLQIAALMCSSPGKPPPKAPDIAGPISFINLTDLHYSSPPTQDHTVMSASISSIISGLVASLNQRNDLDFLVLSGDLAASPNHHNLERVKDSLEALQVPYYVVAGNHDIPARGFLSCDPSHDFEKLFQGHGPGPGRSYWSLDPKPGWHLIGLDSTIPGTWKGKISGKQLQWLEKDLAENTGKNTIVLCHHNLIAHHPLDEKPMWKGYVARNGEAVRRILERFPAVRLVVTGHHHLCSYRSWKGIPYITCPSVASWPCRYSHFHIDRNGIKFTTHPIPFPDLIERARRNLLAYRPHRGLFPPGPEGEAVMLRHFLGPERLQLPLMPGQGEEGLPPQ